jgi:glycosyltransferase involved in cell wall biosynthesis
VPEVPTLPPIKSQPVSILLLADNDAAHLETVVGAWNTFCHELGREYEIILLDDGSTDQTVQLTPALKERTPPLQVVRHDTRLGEGAALKSGLAVARFPLLFYTVCDPCYQPADFKRLLEEIDKVHFISGFRGGHPLPGIVGYFESCFMFL